ncbi:hypothetical protein FT663_05198 [Candidozyma haemuli var. vulneris]|uniref:ADIPOR-like receptor IZH3 n=1 Tax=Candidozyma haemuli TaxID=45357 RepID=A0A2V1ANN9_9ASCO|nr:hypothetical protein CXQ85_001143 [[Candida] haemuloni]KAF3985698.1 hypothetical protein FT663_05198 [[Candida] haemuloni var. vulneris]KAF3990346.1 hypothetical protein FT662_02339 [[Candida] haemuloni var. vulneris]PVH18853.1 hypothetical protein CXQ85_001143 [[Candida] haemuloni]
MSETTLRKRTAAGPADAPELYGSNGARTGSNELLTTEIEKNHEFSSTEELLIEKLDIFLSSIEKRIERFEQYFKVIGSEGAIDEEEENEKEKDTDKEATEGRSRRSSSASLSSITSIRQISISHLNRVYGQLYKVKESVLLNSFRNAEYLYKTLDDQYNYMFNGRDVYQELQDSESIGGGPGAGFPGMAHKEALQNKLIDTLHYFEEKLAHIDGYLSAKGGAVDEDEASSALRFFNFNKALKHSEDGYLHYYQLPLAWRENKYIIEGYRFTMGHVDMVKSMFHFNHNETGNIWTHMLGFFVIAWLALFHFPQTSVYSANALVDNCIMYLFFAASAKCLISSVLWHTYSCFAHLNVRARFACVDYTGITTLITCSVVSAEYCALYHMPKLLAFFVTFSIACGVSGLAFNWSPYFDKPECRHLRIAFFVGLAAMGSMTFFFKWYYEGLSNSLYFYMPLTYKSFLWYWIGVLFYAGLIPERWRYDVIVDQDAPCRHTHTPQDVFGGLENSGKEEIEEIEQEIEDVSREHISPSMSLEKQTMSVIEKHFPSSPTKTPYASDFLSLWWVDYIGSSHNMWHLFVVLGIVGHYFSLLGMFDSIVR